MSSASEMSTAGVLKWCTSDIYSESILGRIEVGDAIEDEAPVASGVPAERFLDRQLQAEEGRVGRHRERPLHLGQLGLEESDLDDVRSGCWAPSAVVVLVQPGSTDPLSSDVSARRCLSDGAAAELLWESSLERPML